MHVDVMEKLTILTDAAKYDAACTSSGAQRGHKTGHIGNTSSSTAGCSFIFIPFLKVKRRPSLLYTVAYSTRLYQSSAQNAVIGPSSFSKAETNLRIFPVSPAAP